MRRNEVYKTAQFWLTLVGGWLVLFSWLSWRQSLNSAAIDSTSLNSTNSLQVGIPLGRGNGTGANLLQGAKNLQSHAALGLQQSQPSQGLQRSAASDAFGSGSGLQ